MIILILYVLLIQGLVVRPYQPTSYNYDYKVESRNANKHHKRKSFTTRRPLIQQYWHNFVRNLPTLPPFSWDMSNSFGNLFRAGEQQVTETPIHMYNMMEEANRKRRKEHKRKSTKKNKNQRKIKPTVRNYYSYDDNSNDVKYQQTQLRLLPLGLDHNMVMHFYEPTSGQYYALQVESQPTYYNQYQTLYNNQYSQYNNYAENGSYDDDHNVDFYYQNHGNGDEDNSYEDEDSSHREDNNAYYDPQSHEYVSDNNDNENNDTDTYGNNNMEYDDDVELVDNWGNNDEEIFADRKLKGKTSNFEALSGSIVKIQKQLLKPETEEDVMKLLTYGKKPIDKDDIVVVKKENAAKKVESVSNTLGTIMNDLINRKQSANIKTSTPLLEKPRTKGKYYIFPVDFWL